MAIAHNTKTATTEILLMDYSSYGEHAEVRVLRVEMSKSRATQR
jgi:hypothetical protein